MVEDSSLTSRLDKVCFRVPGARLAACPISVKLKLASSLRRNQITVILDGLSPSIHVTLSGICPTAGHVYA
jgi:hypothetical protein